MHIQNSISLDNILLNSFMCALQNFYKHAKLIKKNPKMFKLKIKKTKFQKRYIFRGLIHFLDLVIKIESNNILQLYYFYVMDV